MTDIKLLRLTTGEDLVTEIVKEDKEWTTISKPFVIIPMQRNPAAGAETKLYFSPFIPFAENEELKIKTVNIISINEPKTEIRDNYLQYIGAIVPVENKIIS